MRERSVRTFPSVLLVALFAVVGPAAARGDDPGSVRLDGKVVEAATIGATVGPDPARAIELWHDWARAHGYRFELAADGRVILVVDARSKSLRRSWKVVAAVGEWFDDKLPPTFVVAKDVEDAGADPGAAAPRTAAAEVELPRTPVVFSLADDEDYRALLERLVEIEPYLDDWAQRAQRTTGGFTLERPLVAGWVEEGEGREEWNPENELAHRLGHLNLVQRYGQLPFWLQTGLSWQVEQDVAGDIYCFPYRAEFVGVGEHEGWKSSLRSAFRKRKDPEDFVSIEELGAWQRGRFVEEEVANAWGTARFLVQKRPDALPHVLADLSAFRAENEVRHYPDGRWERIAGYEVPLDEQLAIFERHLGEGFRGELTEFFRKGR